MTPTDRKYTKDHEWVILEGEKRPRWQSRRTRRKRWATSCLWNFPARRRRYQGGRASRWSNPSKRYPTCSRRWAAAFSKSRRAEAQPELFERSSVRQLHRAVQDEGSRRVRAAGRRRLRRVCSRAKAEVGGRMRSYVPNTPEERLDMLKAIGLKSMESCVRGLYRQKRG